MDLGIGNEGSLKAIIKSERETAQVRPIASPETAAFDQTRSPPTFPPSLIHVPPSPGGAVSMSLVVSGGFYLFTKRMTSTLCSSATMRDVWRICYSTQPLRSLQPLLLF